MIFDQEARRSPVPRVSYRNATTQQRAECAPPARATGLLCHAGNRNFARKVGHSPETYPHTYFTNLFPCSQIHKFTYPHIPHIRKWLRVATTQHTTSSAPHSLWAAYSLLPPRSPDHTAPHRAQSAPQLWTDNGRTDCSTCIHVHDPLFHSSTIAALQRRPAIPYIPYIPSSRSLETDQ